MADPPSPLTPLTPVIPSSTNSVDNDLPISEVVTITQAKSELSTTPPPPAPLVPAVPETPVVKSPLYEDPDDIKITKA